MRVTGKRSIESYEGDVEQHYNSLMLDHRLNWPLLLYVTSKFALDEFSVQCNFLQIWDKLNLLEKRNFGRIVFYLISCMVTFFICENTSA